MKPTLAQFEKWYDELQPLDRMNVNMLLTLPNSAKLLETSPAGKIRDMATFGQALVRVALKIVREEK